MKDTCHLCDAPLLMGDFCPRCGQEETPCWKCNGDGVYCWTCGEREGSCECDTQDTNLGECGECEGSDDE